MLTKGASTSTADIRRLADRLSGRDVPKLQAYADDLDQVTAAAGRSTAAALRAIRVGIGLNGTMDALDSSRREADRSTHTDDLVALEAVAALHPQASTFEGWLRGVLDRPAVEGPAVLLSTVHRIKGKEWGHVLVFGASEGLFPHRLAEDDEGERRVFHVALTRARTQVAVLTDTDAPSPFVAELNGGRAHTAIGSSRTRPVGREVGAGAGAGGTGTGPGGRRGSKRQAAAEPPVELAEEGRAAERSLREWRSMMAKQESVPAYVVLTDKDLVGIAAALPRTLSELARCRGIGPLKLERWGDEILALLDTGAG
jgi:DNA helicase II / ATP-dependent DNA helicase PcrA